MIVLLDSVRTFGFEHPAVFLMIYATTNFGPHVSATAFRQRQYDSATFMSDSLSNARAVMTYAPVRFEKLHFSAML
jgi:hypothetical protein